MSRVSVRGIAVASATAVTAVGAVVGITGTGVATSNAQTVDTASTTTKLLDVPGTTQAQQVSSGVLQQADAQTAAYDEAQRFAAAEAARIQAEQKAAAEKEAAAKAAAEKAAEEARVAAEKAAAAKAAAEKKAAEERAAAEKASRDQERTAVTSGDPKAIARSMIASDAQFSCFSNIVSRESGWKVTATNPSSGAYGLVQALPGSKMASAGADWRTNPATQIKWGLSYMNSRYGSPCEAWAFWQANHWY
ncbi:lytic transglycosylase domain-containing protein [Yinghuangia sp. ASG 101]|uniref:aggregation-promoting factor C-terminal-like domain-containing protein n=1 Tax=Yinghuangia sp. ASG 101 TaxID=2896848 RepID=UPI001E337918|nr:transglycosylase SLT domain-containing protein [Yinghuangia sp. ASG 101]UGQ09387.1 lytic transglycosylase domain-containing protein [Yinghuangia sp. ASG 101]